MSTPPPAHPKIYHILHVDRLLSVVAERHLFSAAMVLRRGLSGTTVGMQKIKTDRFFRPVTCHSGTMVAQYVPFYFCSRSVMLYMLHMANHENLGYRGGQEPIITLEADLRTVVADADSAGRRWAFSLGNASARYQEFRSDLCNLDEVRWGGSGVPSDIKEGKQAEFLVHERFPWSLVSAIGVVNVAMQEKVRGLLEGAEHRPPVHVRTNWYY